MDVKKTERGFQFIEFLDCNDQTCSLQQSSAILESGDADRDAHAWDAPGSSGIWLGVYQKRMHLNRQQVGQLLPHLRAWVNTGSLEV